MLTSLSALTVQTPYDTPSIPANTIAVVAFQFDGLVHQPPIMEERYGTCGVRNVGVVQRTCWRPHFLWIGIPSATSLRVIIRSECLSSIDAGLYSPLCISKSEGVVGK